MPMCHWCKCPLLQQSGETVPIFGDFSFCSVEHRAYYRAGVPHSTDSSFEGGEHVAQPDLFDHAKA